MYSLIHFFQDPNAGPDLSYFFTDDGAEARVIGQSVLTDECGHGKYREIILKKKAVGRPGGCSHSFAAFYMPQPKPFWEKTAENSYFCKVG